MNNNDKYIQLKADLLSLEADIKASLGAKKGDLVKFPGNDKFYRVGYIGIDDKGIPYARSVEIKNHRINLAPFSSPKITPGNFETINYFFDADGLRALYDQLETEDSIKKASELKDRVKRLVMGCRHLWERNGIDDYYECDLCGSKTAPNGEYQNIDLSFLDEY